MHRYRFVLGGVGIGFALWVFEAAVHVTAFANGELVEQLLPADPNEIWMRLLLLASFAGFGAYAQRSVNQRERAAQKARDAEQWLRTTLTSVGDAVITTDARGRVAFLNPEGRRITGWDVDDARGRPLPEVFDIVNEETNAPVENPVDKVLREKRVVGLANHTVLIGRDGTRRPIADSGAPITDGSGEILGVVLVFRDVSEEREREALLRQHQKLESIGTLAAGVAHEVNNPLNGILNYGELMRMELPPGSDLQEYAAGVVEESQRIARIVETLLQFSRQEKDSHSPARLRDILDSTLVLVGATFRKAQIEVSVDVPEDLPTVECRTQRVQQVLVNLLNNARDALNERYPGEHEDKQVHVRAAPHADQAGRWLRLTVEDHGSGVPVRDRERIFDPFFTTKSRDQGTGLGLAVSFGITREHGGRLLVESEEGQGSRFHLDLPMDDEAGGDSAGAPRSEGGPR